MAKTTETGEKGRLTRERLISCGFSLLINKGVPDVSLDDILKFSDVKKGAFYYYFESKDEFVQACFEERYVKAVQEVMDEFFEVEACSVSEIAFFFNNYVLRVKSKLDAILGDYKVEMDAVFANLSYLTRKFEYAKNNYMNYHLRQRQWVEQCLERMKSKGLIDGRIICPDMAQFMCCCREGAFMMTSVRNDMDYDTMMVISMRFFEQILGIKG